MAQMQKFGIKLDPTRGSDEFTQSEFYSRPELWDREGMRDWSINSDDATSLLRQVQKHNWSEAARDSPNLLDLPRELLDPNLTVDAALPWLGLQKSGDNYTFAGPSKTPHFPGEGGFGNFLKVAAPFMLGGGALLGGFGGAAGVAGGAAGGAPVSQIPLFGQAPLAGVPVSSNAAWMAPGAAGGASDLAKLASGASSLFSDGSENFEAGSLEAASNMGGGGGIGSVLSSIFGGGGGAAGGAGGLLSLLSKGLDIGTGLYGIKQAGDLKDFASETSRSMDPFGPYRSSASRRTPRRSRRRRGGTLGFRRCKGRRLAVGT
jgi:hypothetical protein